jgi:DNA-binding phage protein
VEDKKMITVSKFDAADYLDDEEAIAAYLSEATASQPSAKSKAGVVPRKKRSSSRTGMKSAACLAAAASRGRDNTNPALP